MPWYVLLAIVLVLREYMSTSTSTSTSTSSPTSTKPTGRPDPQMTEHFRWSEFYRPNDQTPPESVIKGYAAIANHLETIRGYFGGQPIVITPHGGWHPMSKTGGSWPDRSRNSRHRTPEDRGAAFQSGVAVDFFIPGVKIEDVYTGMQSLRYNKGIPKGGIGLYKSDGFIHWDTRSKPANWTDQINSNEGE